MATRRTTEPTFYAEVGEESVRAAMQTLAVWSVVTRARTRLRLRDDVVAPAQDKS
jgi:hypothetical protein